MPFASQINSLLLKHTLLPHRSIAYLQLHRSISSLLLLHYLAMDLSPHHSSLALWPQINQHTKLPFSLNTNQSIGTSSLPLLWPQVNSIHCCSLFSFAYLFAGAASRMQLSADAQLQYFGHCGLGSSRRNSAGKYRPEQHAHHPTRRAHSALATSTTTTTRAAPTAATLPPHQ
eukprot:scaffold88556_cov18-Tisochrysis_lutea.AAC.3